MTIKALVLRQRTAKQLRPDLEHEIDGVMVLMHLRLVLVIFFKVGWTPKKGVSSAIKAFGHTDKDLSELERKGQQTSQEFIDLGYHVRISPDHASSIFAYTQENAHDLYGKLNQSMRTSGGISAKRLELYLDYIYHLSEGLAAIPNFVGTTFRGIKDKLHSKVYQVGSTITWQSFTSSSVSLSEAINFVHKYGVRLVGSLFVLRVKSGKLIEDFSDFPYEQEVLFKYNSFWEVRKRVDDEDEKRTLLPQLEYYELFDLHVYELYQL